MKFTINTRKFVIKFHHERGRHINFTKATLLEEGNPLQRGPIAVGVSNCHPNDNFCKSTGRKVAFTRLLLRMMEEFIISSRLERALLWEAYFKAFKK
jgi:hypothetical protein